MYESSVHPCLSLPSMDFSPACLLPFPFAVLFILLGEQPKLSGIHMGALRIHTAGQRALWLCSPNSKIMFALYTTVNPRADTFRGQTAMRLSSISLVLSLLKEHSSRKNYLIQLLMGIFSPLGKCKMVLAFSQE